MQRLLLVARPAAQRNSLTVRLPAGSHQFCSVHVQDLKHLYTRHASRWLRNWDRIRQFCCKTTLLG